MSNFPTYRFSVQAIIMVVLLGVVWANLNTSISWVLALDAETYELCDPEDNKSEKEEKKGEEDPDDKVQSDLASLEMADDASFKRALTGLHGSSIYLQDIQTPPPERLLPIPSS